MKTLSILILFLSPLGDSLQPVAQNIEFLYQLLLEQTEDRLSEALEIDGDSGEDSHEELIEDYLFYLENPININSEEVVHLEEIGLLSAFQVEALRQYRRQFGDLMFSEELLMLDDYSEATVAVITPLVHFGKSERTQEREKMTLGKVLTRGRHQVTFNYAQKLQFKYNYHYKQKFRFGIATRKEVGGSSVFDFVGVHCYASDLKIGNALTVKDLALGDYQLSFGQGLTLWSGMSVGKGSGGISLMKRAAGIKPKASSSEGKFFRGAATTWRFHDFYATAFYSNRRVDSIRQQAFGGHFCYAGPHFEVGYTLYHVRLSKPLELKPTKYNQFYFQGDRLTDMGLDFRWLFGKAAFFGELARSDNGAFAGLVGMTVKPKGYINFNVLYRNYDKRYQSLFNGAFGESSRGQGEEGVYLGLQCAPAPSWDLLAYCDFFRLTWLSSTVYNPSWGQEYSLKLSHQISRTASMQLRFKSKTKMKNSVDDHVFSHYPIFYNKQSLNFQISYGVTESLTFSNKASYSHYRNDDGTNSRGYLLCHDVAFKPVDKPYSLTFRYALYGSDDYYSRISIYENDVLGAFSIPNLYGRGSRAYLLGKLKLFGSLSLYSRIGINVLAEETKTDLKVELIWKP